MNVLPGLELKLFLSTFHFFKNFNSTHLFVLESGERIYKSKKFEKDVLNYSKPKYRWLQEFPSCTYSSASNPHSFKSCHFCGDLIFYILLIVPRSSITLRRKLQFATRWKQPRVRFQQFLAEQFFLAPRIPSCPSREASKSPIRVRGNGLEINIAAHKPLFDIHAYNYSGEIRIPARNNREWSLYTLYHVYK